jgi:hypothetical protein
MVTVAVRWLMANGPFTIRIFVPDGDPEGVRLIDRNELDRSRNRFPS